MPAFENHRSDCRRISPMSDESSRYHIAFNGEIYNFRRLRDAFSSDYSFFSSSDTEVILRSFQQCGEKTWSRLNGMFAVAVYDAKPGALFLARDHAGIKPLYYYHDQEKLLFASEIKALLASGLVPVKTDQEGLSLYLQIGYLPGSRTAYRGIQKVLPAEGLKIDSAGIHRARFWDVRDSLSNDENHQSFPVAAEELERLLLRSVEDQMISDVPIGAFLSGGIDSSMIVALMSKLAAEKVRTFTVGFSNMGYYDE
ncbi:MAG TPA: asparagine synthase-related protein, partial [Acidobacteriota bacterium]